MKKLLIVLMLVLTLALSGCERTSEFVGNYQNVSNDNYFLTETEYEWFKALQNCDSDDIEEPECEVVGFYTQEEVDALLQDLRDELEETYYTKEELDEGFEDVALWIEEHEQTPRITTCWLNNLSRDMLVAYNDGYTFDMNQYGVMFELKDGIYTGDSWTNQDLIDEYCTIESE